VSVPVFYFEQPYWSAKLHRLRGVFLTALGIEEASFCEAIRIARKQMSISLATRAAATYQGDVDSDYLFGNAQYPV